MQIQRDSRGQPYIEWAQAANGFKRAWVQDRAGTDKDWAGSGRYINVVRIERLGAGPAGNATDFPVFSPLPDAQLLVAFVTGVSAITGCALHWSGDATS